MTVGISAEVVLAGRYRLDERIAVGGAGEVWRGRDVLLARPVAVKLLRAECARHAETLERFRSEARHAGSMSDPHIVQVYDYCEAHTPDRPFLVMELVEGPSLAGVLAGGPLPPAETLNIIAQAALGLHAAHSAGLVHGDIKPANLLIGPGGQVKITDFGIAHLAGTAAPDRDEAVMGTPAYLAPERFAGDPVSPVSDLYALGIVAYECLAGVPPFAGGPREMAAAHLTRPLPRLPAAVPAQVAALVAELAAREPVARPQDAIRIAIRAFDMRDRLPPDSAIQHRHWPSALQPPPADNGADTLVNLRPEVMADVLEADPAVTGRRLPVRRRRQMRAVILAIAAATSIGLGGWLVAAMRGTDASRPLIPLGTNTTAPPAALLARVDSGLLVGQPVSAARQRLIRLGLQVRVRWQFSDLQPARTVVSVQPAGELPLGSIVVITGALQLPNAGHGGGNGGDGGGGNGGDGGTGGGH